MIDRENKYTAFLCAACFEITCSSHQNRNLSYYKRNFNGGSAIANGKHILEEEGIVVNVSEYTTRLLEKCKWEVHKKYSLIINLQK